MKKNVFILFSILSLLYSYPLCAGEQPKNVILMIGDGMGIAHVYAAYTVQQGRLNIFQAPYTGFSITCSYSDYITDSSAAATAMACGQKTYNGAVGIDNEKRSIPSMLELAEQKGLATGLVATCYITHATPASFIAHQNRRDDNEAIALDFLKTDVDVVIGGGQKFFNNRSDKQDLLQELENKGYKVYDRISAISKNDKKIYCLTATEHNPDMMQNRGDYLRQASAQAIQILKENPKGFFIMIEGSMIDFKSHDNKDKEVLAEVLDFDQAVAEVLKFAREDKNTLVIITADHETGGLTLTGGDLKQGRVDMKFSSSGHTAVMVPVFAYGPGAEQFTGVYQNTEIFNKITSLLKIK